MFRLLQSVEIPDLARGFAKHRESEHSAAVTTEALEIFGVHGSTPQGRLAQLAAAAAADSPTIALAFAALVNELLAAL